MRTKAVLAEVGHTFKSGSLRRISIAIFAIFLIIIGAIGSLIPLFPGRTTMFVGLVLLSIQSPSVHAFIKRKTQKYPRLQSRADRFRNWCIRRIHR